MIFQRKLILLLIWLFLLCQLYRYWTFSNYIYCLFSYLLYLPPFFSRSWKSFLTLSSCLLPWRLSASFLLFRHFYYTFRFSVIIFLISENSFLSSFYILFHSYMSLFHPCEYLQIAFHISLSAQVTCLFIFIFVFYDIDFPQTFGGP